MLRLEEVQRAGEEMRRRDQARMATFELDERARGRIGEQVIGQIGDGVDDFDVALERRRVICGQSRVRRRRVRPAGELQIQRAAAERCAP